MRKRAEVAEARAHEADELRTQADAERVRAENAEKEISVLRRRVQGAGGGEGD
jgi:hypothetical protein